MKKEHIVTAGIIAVLVLSFVQDCYSIPAFARKYGTSCTTCHVAFPKLNSFGEAFRLNGFVIPEADEDFIKEEQMRLGAESYKRVWPNAIWPTTMPGIPPISLSVTHGFVYDKNGEVRTEFTAPTVNILLAGSFGESISFYTGLHLFDNGKIGSLGRAYIKFNNLLYDYLPSTRLYFRIGQFLPDAVPFANHRNLSLNSFALNSYYPDLGGGFQAGHHGGATGFNLENNQLGAELTGIIKSRFRFGVGLVNGNGPGGEDNKAKDGYFRLAYKFGGMAFDGSTGDGSSAELSQTNNWKENSIRFGVFGYAGGADNQGTNGPNDLKFHRIGGDVSLKIGNLNLFGGYLQGRDRVMRSEILTPLDYNLFFADSFLLIYPWLIGSVRYEQVNPEGIDSFARLVPHISILARANVRLLMESSFDTDNFNLTNFQYIFQYAF